MSISPLQPNQKPVTNSNSVSKNNVTIKTSAIKDALNVLKIPEKDISMIIKESGSQSTSFRDLPNEFAVELAAHSAMSAIVSEDERKKLENIKIK